jgi:hypothetical protein
VTWLIVATIVMFALLAAAVRQARGWAAWLVISQAALPIAAGLALSIGRPIFLDRYFLFASAFWSILIAGLIARLSRPDVRQAAAGFVVLLSVAALAKNMNAIGLVSIRHPVEKPGMAGAAALVNHEARGGDAIIVAHSLIYFPFKYYNRTIIQPSLYSTIPLERFPRYAGQALLDPAQMTDDLGALSGPRRVWYLWTDGFYQKKVAVPTNWRLQSTHRFDDTPGYKGSIVVDEYAIPQ